MSMWEPFTEQARRSMVLSQEVAQRLRTPYIDADHIFLGIVEEGNSLAAQAIRSFGVTDDAVRIAAERKIGRGKVIPREIVFTPEAKRMIEHAFEVTRERSDNYLGAEHLMIAWTRERGPNNAILSELGIEPEALRAKILDELSRHPLRSSILGRSDQPVEAATVTFSSIFEHVRFLDRPGIQSAVDRESERRLYYIDTEQLWQRLQACAARRDIIGALLYGILIDCREGRSHEQTALEIGQRINENFER